MELPKVTLKPGRDRSVLLRHPWVYSGAIDKVTGTPQPGGTVDLLSSGGEFLARGAWSGQSSIRVRIWAWERCEIDAWFFAGRIHKAVEARKPVIPPGDTAVRLVYAESDGLPGLIVDRYADALVVQILSAGPEYMKETIFDALVGVTGITNIYERSDVDVRALEGLPERAGAARGNFSDKEIVICEDSHRFNVDIQAGQKTGFYIDQRRNRKRVGELVDGRKVLNCFCYTGGFSIYALAGGAEQVISVDSSAEALALAEKNVSINDLPGEKAEWLKGDVFQVLRRFRDESRQFDAIILDPPKFAPTAAQAERAARGYKDINLLAFKLLAPGGMLFTFSCSGGISAELFQKIVAGAALDARVDAHILEHFTQGPDHPVALNFPEAAYLKGLVCRIT